MHYALRYQVFPHLGPQLVVRMHADDLDDSVSVLDLDLPLLHDSVNDLARADSDFVFVADLLGNSLRNLVAYLNHLSFVNKLIASSIVRRRSQSDNIESGFQTLLWRGPLVLSMLFVCFADLVPFDKGQLLPRNESREVCGKIHLQLQNYTYLVQESCGDKLLIKIRVGYFLQGFFFQVVKQGFFHVAEDRSVWNKSLSSNIHYQTMQLVFRVTVVLLRILRVLALSSFQSKRLLPHAEKYSSVILNRSQNRDV